MGKTMTLSYDGQIDKINEAIKILEVSIGESWAEARSFSHCEFGPWQVLERIKCLYSEIDRLKEEKEELLIKKLAGI